VIVGIAILEGSVAGTAGLVVEGIFSVGGASSREEL